MLEVLRFAVNDVLRDPKGLGADVIAARMGVPRSTLYSYGELGPTGRDIPVEKLVRLVLASEDARPLVAVCAAAGGTFLPVPRAADGAVDAALVALIKNFGAAVEEVASDVRDGIITPTELRRIRKDVTATQAALAHLLAAAERRAEGGA